MSVKFLAQCLVNNINNIYTVIMSSFIILLGYKVQILQFQIIPDDSFPLPYIHLTANQ